jgi:hypothetical protein
MGMARILINNHARMDAGPAESAVRPGRRSIPDPRTDPIYRGIICHKDRDAVLGIDGCKGITGNKSRFQTLYSWYPEKKRYTPVAGWFRQENPTYMEFNSGSSPGGFYFS